MTFAKRTTRFKRHVSEHTAETCTLLERKTLQYLTLPAGDYANEIIATPYVVATEPIYGFTSADHAAEIRELKPEGFDLPRGAILAVANSIRIVIAETSPHSVIDLVANAGTRSGHYDLDLTNDRIKLYVNPADKLLLERFRSQQPDQLGRTHAGKPRST